MKKEDVEKYVLWYKAQEPLYNELSTTVYGIIKQILSVENIDYYNIEPRAKSISSFQEKVSGNIKFDPKDMQDLAGVRIIGYVIADVEKISRIIEKNFVVDEKRSKNKKDILGEEKVGYQSIHYVCKLSKTREKLPENKKFKDLYFEIQVRTILQHAWAEIEHDRKYKFSGELPEGIPRRFNLIAGLLEIADNEFEALANMVSEYSEYVRGRAKKGDLDIPVNPASLTQFMKEKFSTSKYIIQTFGDRDDTVLDIVNEIKDMGIKDLKKFDSIIPHDMSKFYTKDYRTTFSGIVRDILMSHDTKKYFESSWKQHWFIRDNFPEEHYKKLNIDITVAKNHLL